MSRRSRKQFAYGLLYLALVALVATLVYFALVRAPASCENNRKDAGEEGVDCGGICTRACIPGTLHDVEQVGNVRVFRSTPNTLEVLAKIQNANPQFAARSFGYRFNIFDETGALLDTIQDTSFIYGGEVKYLSVIKTGVNYRVGSAELVIGFPEWDTSSNVPRPVLGAVQDKQFRVTSSSVEVSGRVSNKDVVTFPSVIVTAVFYNSFAIPVGISETELSNVAPEDSRSFTVLHPAVADIVPEETELIITAKRP